MNNLLFSNAQKVYTTNYGKFKGVDFSTDPFLVDQDRSPWAPNLISDTGGMPEKRMGWRVLQTFAGTINGVFRAEINNVEYLLVHAGTSIFNVDLTNFASTSLIGSVNDARSTSIFWGGYLYIFTGAQFLVFNGSSITAVNGKIPEVIIGRNPTSGGGTPLEDINLIQPKWTEGFLGTASTVAYQLSYGSLDATLVTAKKMTAAGTWTDLYETTDFRVERTTGVVTFNTAPGASPVTGQDNVKITAAKTRAGYADKINKASIVTLYNNVLFCAGSEKGLDYHSGFNDPTYWPDTGYDEVGSNGTDIMGYLPIGEYLGIVKEDNDQDSTVFLRNIATLDDEKVFTKVPAISGIGAISKKSFGTLRGEQLFLSRQGVFAITSNIVTSEKIVQNRSYFVDFKLTSENDLDKAVAVEWNGYFLVCVNSNCYILDGKQNKTYKQQNGDYVYECYHWTNIPAVCFLQTGGTLYFGTSDGKLCMFNSDIPTMSKYSDNHQPITCRWTTKADDDGDFMRVKHLQRQGCGILIKPYTHTSAAVYAATEQDVKKEVASAEMDIFDFRDLDFSRFTFNTSDRPQIIPLTTNVRRYKTLQFTVENNVLNEGFGVYGLIKRYRVGGYSR